MKNAFLMALLAAFTLGAIPAHAQSAAEKEVLAQEDLWLKSEQTNNPDLAAPLFADDYVATGADGSIANKADTLAEAKARTWSTSKYEDVRAKVYGETAVTTGGYLGKGTSGGKPFTEHLRWTDTWAKMSGKWVLVASHYSMAKAKAAKPSP